MCSIGIADDVEITSEAMICSVAISLDDLINGNVTSTGAFFLGLGPLQEQLIQLRDNDLPIIQTQFQNIDETGGTVTTLAVAKGDEFLVDISQVPVGTANLALADYDYNSFDGSGGTVASTFPGLLGSVAAQDGQVYDTYYDVAYVRGKI